MNTIRRILLIFFCMLCTFAGKAQEDADFRMEIGGSLGTCFYLGDLNEKFYHQTAPSLGVLWRYLYNPRSSFKAAVTWGKVKGESKLAPNYFPEDLKSGTPSLSSLDYSFSSSVIDLGCLYEINFWPYGYYQNFRGQKRLTPFLQMGLGLTYVGMDKSVTANIPLGVGVKYKMGKRWNIALDWAIHFSLSDKIDGLEAPLGISSEGLKNKDSYQTTLITITYSFCPICPTCNKD